MKFQIVTAAAVSLSAASAFAQPIWEDVTAEAIGETAGWTHRVELADLDGDGDLDLIFANGGNYSTAGSPELNAAWQNNGDGTFTDVSDAVFAEADLTRVIKARDLNEDGHVDLVIGATYGAPSKLLLGGPGLTFTEAPERLPGTADSLGDLEFGDVDGDGDLDIVVVDWGDGDGLNNTGGAAKIWLNDGSAHFSVGEGIPQVSIRMSWDLELVDIDNDFDLDLLVASKVGLRNELFINDGSGKFTGAPERLPQFIGTEGFEAMDMNRDGEPEANNYDFEAADLNGDGFLDLITVNDGDLVDPADMFHRREHILFNDGEGGFFNATPQVWPNDQNTGWDDNAVVVFDLDSDGDPDFLLGSLSGPDRILINDGGTFELHDPIMESPGDSPGTLGIALGDLNGDGRLDLVQTQGELAFDERVYLATSSMAPDTIAPFVTITLVERGVLRARVHDNKSPQRPHELRSVEARWADGSAEMKWYGETLWRADVPEGIEAFEICATDAAGNEGCAPVDLANGAKADEGNADQDDTASSGGCAAGSGSPGPFMLLLIVGLFLSRRRY